MKSYAPDQRIVSCQILSQVGWLHGDFHLIRNAKFADQLDSTNEFFKLTDVSFMGKAHTMSFLALQKEATILVLPPASEGNLVRKLVEEQTAHRVHCIFDRGIVSGDLVIRSNIRVSDYLVKQDGFVLLSRCVLRLGNLQDEFFVEEKHPSVLVNAPKILGISEDDPFS